MEITQFKSFYELTTTPVNENEYNQITQIIEEIYNTSLENQTWIGAILDFLNDNNTGKEYTEYHLPADLFYGTRRYAYRFISTQEDMPYSITDSDIAVLQRLKAQPQFILYDYEHEEKTSEKYYDYWTQTRTLKKVLESIGMTKELKEHLCEFCFYQIKREKEKLIKSNEGKVWNPDLWEPLNIKPVEIEDTIEPSQSTGGFLPYQRPEDRYEVRGIMPSAKIQEQYHSNVNGKKLVLSKNNENE